MLFWYECPSVVFSLQELTFIHCVFGAVTCKILCVSFFMHYM